MKKIIMFAASVAAVTAIESCKKNFVDAPVTCANTRISVKLAGTVGTRAEEEGITAENTINSVDLLVFFNGGEFDGRLDAFAHLTGAPYTVDATSGNRKVYAIVNSPVDLSYVENESQLLASDVLLTSQKTGSGNLSNFTMIGSKTQTLASGNNPVTVSVGRIASRVRIRKITRDFGSAALAAQSFSVDAMYLSNIVTRSPYSLNLTPVAADFANKLGVCDNAFDTWAKRSVSTSLSDESSVSLDDASNYMYCFPNSISADSEEDVFEVQNTKVVVECTLEGKKLYYVIPLGALEPNHSYDVSELVLTCPGSDDPNHKTEISSCNFTINVLPWTLVPVETEPGKYVI